MNNYTTIILKGKPMRVCFEESGLIRILKRKFGLKFTDVFLNFKDMESIMEYMPEIIYSAAACYCSINEKDVDFTIEQITSDLDGRKVTDYLPIIDLLVENYINPLKERAASQEVKKSDEPFLVGESRGNLSGSNDDAPVGTGSIHVQRPAYENTGI